MQQQQPHSETPTSDSAVDAPEKQQVTSATKPALDPEEARILRDKAQALRTEIDELILKLDSNLADREARSELKQRIGVLTEQYNALVLPLAMEAMQRGS